MIEQTIRHQAKELAGAFYEFNQRSDKFRRAFPTVEDYLHGRQHMADGRVKRIPPGWQHHVVLARKTLVLMLSMPDARVSPAMKERIYDALKEDRDKSMKMGRKVAQRLTPGDNYGQPK